MNIFRFAGDLLHLASFFILLLKMYHTRSVRGVSLHTQLAYCVVFVTRYLDLFWNWSSLYNVAMKIIFLVLSFTIVYIMKIKKPFCRTYESSNDKLNVIYLIIPTFFLSLIWNEEFTISEILWAFSIYLEAIAILPQLVVVHRQAKETGGFVDTLSSHYVFSLGGYRACYLLNWIYRLFTETGYSNRIVWVAGSVQTLIFCDFFYYYLKAQIEGTTMTLPA